MTTQATSGARRRVSCRREVQVEYANEASFTSADFVAIVNRGHDLQPRYH